MLRIIYISDASSSSRLKHENCLEQIDRFLIQMDSNSPQDKSQWLWICLNDHLEFVDKRRRYEVFSSLTKLIVPFNYVIYKCKIGMYIYHTLFHYIIAICDSIITFNRPEITRSVLYHSMP
jgi:hypothetical protein